MKKNVGILIVSILLLVVIVMLGYLIGIKDKVKDDDNKIIADTSFINVTKSETSDSVIYEVVDSQKGLSYSWTFEKNDEYKKSLKDNMEIDVNLKLNLLDSLNGNPLDSRVTNKDKLIVSFEHHGSLPTKAKIKINVKDKYSDGEKLYLYYYNEEYEQIEFIENDLLVKNGQVEFEIDHCSNYLLTASIVQDAVNNPKNINLIIIVMVAVIIVLIGVTLFQNKK